MLEKVTGDIIALNLVEGLGPVSIGKLLEAFDETEDIFISRASELEKILGKRSKSFSEIKTVRKEKKYKEELSYIEKNNIKAVSLRDEDYPDELKSIYDPPPVLYVKGSLLGEDSLSVAVVGSRKCSLYGLKQAERLAYELASRGITVISGLARGIDSAAHRGAIKAGGRTIAVTGSGFRTSYPPGSERFEEEIASHGAVITEFPSYMKPLKGNFPRRNRIISGLSKGVVVVEAAQRSGALITADFALEEGREVFAVPGPIDSVSSRGANSLLKAGAKLVTCVEDILDELRIDRKTSCLKQLR